MAHEEPSKLPYIIFGAVLAAALLVIVWQEFRYSTASAEVEQMGREASRISVETRQNRAALELSAHAYRTEAEQLRNQIATLTADRPLDRLAEVSDKRDLDLCRQGMRDIFDHRVLPLARKACGVSKPDPALSAAWKAVAKDAPDWVEFFRARFPGFGPGCFDPAAVDDPAAGRVDNDISTYPDLPALISSYCIVSPARDYCLYLDYPTGQPDSSARVWDVNGNRELWKLDCGTPCHWDYAVWLDPTTVAVIGLAESYYMPLPIFTAEVRVVQVKDGKVSTTGIYRGPDVDPASTGAGATYADNHKKWLTRKGKSRAE